MRPARLALALLPVVAAGAGAETFRVGPSGRPYTQLWQVAPLVGPGDLVLVDGGATYEPVLFENDGTPGAPIVVRGLRAAGARPVLAGGTNTIEIQSHHFVLEGFAVTGGSFRCVYHHADDVVLRDLFVHDCPAHGILGADEDSGSLTLEYSEVTRAGNGTSQHAVYVTSDQNAFPGSVFRMRHCWLHDQNGGNAVKSRAERNEIRFNWIEGARYHLLELIGPDEGAVTPPPGIREDSDVVGNVLVHKAYDPPPMPWGVDPPAVDGNFYFVRTGADVRCDDGGQNSSRGRYRFVNNTFARADGGAGSHVFRPFGYLQAMTMSNNVFWSAPAGAVPMVRADDGERCWTDGEQIAGQGNWVESGTAALPASWTGTVTGASPGFVNAAALDLRPAWGSPLLGQATATPVDPPGFPFPNPHFPPAFEPPLRSVLPGSPPPARRSVGQLDIGAYEFPGSLFTDGFESSDLARWSASFP